MLSRDMLVAHKTLSLPQFQAESDALAAIRLSLEPEFSLRFPFSFSFGDPSDVSERAVHEHAAMHCPSSGTGMRDITWSLCMSIF